MHSSKTFPRSSVPRPLTAESFDKLKEPSSSQLAYEGLQKHMIKLDDLEIEREDNKRDKKDEDCRKQSEIDRTEGTSDSMEDEDRSGRGGGGAATPTAGSQNGDDEDMDEVGNENISHDIKIIKRFLEYIDYSKDQKKVAVTVGWRMEGKQVSPSRLGLSGMGTRWTAGRMICKLYWYGWLQDQQDGISCAGFDLSIRVTHEPSWT